MTHTVEIDEIATLLLWLDQLSALNDDELLGYFTSERIKSLRFLSGVLKEGMEFETILSEKRFLSVIRELSETRKIWSGRLEETLSSAAEEFDRGNSVQALWILNGFIRFCPSPYYRSLAEGVMGEYEKG